MISDHFVLIFISIDLVSGEERLKNISRELRQAGTILAASSVYKRYLNERLEDLNSELVMVFKMQTKKSEMELFQLLKRIEKAPKQHQPGSSETILLLSYDQKTRMVPGQNLPNLLLHQDWLALRCAAEIWGTYEHPVIGKSLNEVVGSQLGLGSVEFFSQFMIEKSHLQDQEPK